MGRLAGSALCCFCNVACVNAVHAHCVNGKTPLLWLCCCQQAARGIVHWHRGLLLADLLLGLLGPMSAPAKLNLAAAFMCYNACVDWLGFQARPPPQTGQLCLLLAPNPA
jgi:hypothetical protein